MRISIDNSSPFTTQEDTCSVLANSLTSRGHEVRLHMGDQPFYARIKSFPCDYYFTDINVIDQDMQHYLCNVPNDTLFIINLPYNVNTKNILLAEDMLLRHKVKYKFVGNFNFGKKGFLLKEPKNAIKFCHGQTGYLLDDKNDIKWDRTIDTLFVVQDNKCDISEFYKLAQMGITFNTMCTRFPNYTGPDQFLNMLKPLEGYKNILCNYESFCFWKLDTCPLGRDFYELMRLRKPVYVYDPISVNHIHKTLKEEVDLSLSNKGNIDFEPLYDKVEKEFSFEQQVDKLLSHLPKVKK